MGIKGNLSAINGIPFQAPPLAAVPAKYDPKTQAVGVGYTPEGLDQNTAYCKLLQASLQPIGSPVERSPVQPLTKLRLARR